MKQQATKANRAQVELHILRQKTLKDRMIGDEDEPHWSELLAVAAVVIVAGYSLIEWVLP